jgi:2-succinyl-5-enolpyruvyl-6-hydroxy-3-cyclohexene-1-carboxylate synthase
MARRPGPVHLNLPFREPLDGACGVLPPPRDADQPWSTVATAGSGAPPVPLDEHAGRRGVVIAGRAASRSATEVASALRWPLLADPLSGVRAPGSIGHADAFLRSRAAAIALRPEVIVRFGEPPASRVVNEWLDAAAGVPTIVVADRWSDPGATASLVASAVGVPSRPTVPDGWLDTWRAVDTAAAETIGALLDDGTEVSEPATARTLLAALPAGANLVVASSMPVRDVEWYAAPRGDVAVLANRGANGIDGVVSSAVGVALATGSPTAALVGDLAFIHDSNGLLGVDARDIDLVCVVADNDGGGIFSFLPQASSVESKRFEQLFGTPHGIDLVSLAAAYGVTARSSTSVDRDVRDALAAGGVHVLVVRTDRAANVEVHRRINEAVARAVDSVLAPSEGASS